MKCSSYFHGCISFKPVIKASNQSRNNFYVNKYINVHTEQFQKKFIYLQIAFWNCEDLSRDMGVEIGGDFLDLEFSAVNFQIVRGGRAQD